MALDSLEFFREFTLKICSSLNINVALNRSWEYMRQYIDCDVMTLHLTEQNFVHILAVAGDLHKDLTLPLRVSILDSMSKTLGTIDPAIIINDSELSPELMKILNSLGIYSNYSCIVVNLELEYNRIGSLCVWSRMKNHFSSEDVNLLQSIRETLSFIMSNFLKNHDLFNTQTVSVLMNDSEDLEVIGLNSGLKNVLQKIQAVANFNSPVLLHGETGVGKEVIAKMIHRFSGRNNGPFIMVNCGAIPDSLIDSELFGYEKGAFTGAFSTKSGRFERADRGTIFLDEISEMPIMAQTRLLHVLQNKVIERVGGTESVKIDIRIIAATNRDLKKMTEASEFRKDLWFRLNIYPIDIPPLRARKEDIPTLIDYFIRKKSCELDINPIPGYSKDELYCLLEYDWPGNIRELKNIVERALINNKGGMIRLKDYINTDPVDVIPVQSLKKTSFISSLDESISNAIHKALIASNGKISGIGGAAGLLNTNPSTLRNKMKKLGIVSPHNKPIPRFKNLDRWHGTDLNIMT